MQQAFRSALPMTTLLNHFFRRNSYCGICIFYCMHFSDQHCAASKVDQKIAIQYRRQKKKTPQHSFSSKEMHTRSNAAWFPLCNQIKQDPNRVCRQQSTHTHNTHAHTHLHRYNALPALYPNHSNLPTDSNSDLNPILTSILNNLKWNAC